MACKHENTVKINDVKVCLKCGMTLTMDGKILFDKEIVNYTSKKRKKGAIKWAKNQRKS